MKTIVQAHHFRSLKAVGITPKNKFPWQKQSEAKFNLSNLNRMVAGDWAITRITCWDDCSYKPNHGGGEMVASEWLDQGRARSSPIDAFADFWRAFNNLYRSASGSPEIEKVRAFLASQIPPSYAVEILNNYAPQIAYLTSRPVVDMRGNGRDTSDAITAFKSLGSDSQQKFSNLFAIIYQVRCNLEHGQKSPRDDRDIELCESAAPVVSAVVGYSIGL